MSNGDKIRKMNDDELANFLIGITKCDFCEHEAFSYNCINCSDCRVPIKKWLEEEA